MPPTADRHEVIRDLLHRRHIATLEALFEALGTRSRMTVFRRLKEAGYYSSFTHNGRYYTLQEIPRFDAQGLWFHGAVGLSRFGTLKETVAHLVPRAAAGGTQSELAALLRVRVHNPLLDLVRSGRIGRENIEGVGEFLYVSTKATEAREQIMRRIESLQVSEARPLPPTETVVAILGEALRAGRVKVAAERIARRLRAQGVAVGLREVERVFEHYGLLAGKKNRWPPPTPSAP
jgi:hypothetical protein